MGEDIFCTYINTHTQTPEEGSAISLCVSHGEDFATLLGLRLDSLMWTMSAAHTFTQEFHNLGYKVKWLIVLSFLFFFHPGYFKNAV